MKKRHAWKKGGWIAAAALSLLIIVATVPSDALAATCMVTTDADSGTNSLRECVVNASSGDTVVFYDNYTIVLTTGQLTIGKELTIDGEDHDIVVSGNGASRVFEIASGTTGTVTLRNLTVRDGYVSPGNGGGILNQAALALENCAVEQNHASGLGGGIYNSNVSGTTLSVASSAISDNSANNGGGIRTRFACSIENSTLSGNSAVYGGGVSADYYLSIENSTVSGNSATLGGGLYINAATADVTDCTIFGNSCGPANNGGGIYLRSTTANSIRLENTALAGNTAGGSIDNVRLYLDGASIDSLGHNLSDTSEFTALASDLVDKDLADQIKLDGLDDNGGPTMTHALLPGSLAIGAGSSSNGTDQRGEARVGTPDIGAFEYQGDHPDVAPSQAGADSYNDISGQTLVASDGSTVLAELEITSGWGAGSLTVARYETGCEPVCEIGFCWDATVEGSFIGHLTFHYGDLDLGGRNEANLRLYHYLEGSQTWEDMYASVDTDNDTITATNVDQDDFSVYTMDTSKPNLIFLSSFEALYSDNGVALSWETASEIDNAGFRLWRADAKDGEYACIVEDLIPATGNEVTGASYSWFDAAVSGSSHFYKLEDIDYGGQSTMRPLTARRLDLSLGWNLIDGAEFAGQSPASALSSISGKYQSAWGLSDGQWRTYDPARPEFGDLETFEAGVDYYLYVVEPCELTLP